MIMDIVVASVLLAVCKKQGSVTFEELLKRVSDLNHVLRDEYNDRDNQPFDQKLRERVKVLVHFKQVSFNEANGEIAIAQNTSTFLLTYLNTIGHYIGDAYLIVVIALGVICEANHNINETRVVDELHAAIIRMHEKNMLYDLPSCLKELIETALRRFAAIELAVIKRYTTDQGSMISFVSVPYKRRQNLHELKLKINELQQFPPH